MAIPSIACLGIIGKNNNPLHISIFPSTSSNPPTPIRTPLQFSLILSSSLDIFEARTRTNATNGQGQVSGDFGLLHALDDRVSLYGFETNTGVKFIAVVDMKGRDLGGVKAPGAPGTEKELEGRQKAAAVLGVREADLKPVFRAMQVAYVRLLQNPFYTPDEHAPASGKGGKMITSKRFALDMQRIGEMWAPGVTIL